MKTTTRFFLFIIFLISIPVSAQVKIGDNPNTIDQNSLLELESANKGFLAPRVALTNVTSPSPLTAPIPVGMLVYSTGGTITDGFYVWSGTKWLNLLTNINQRNNFVLVKSAADLPAPVAGVITLASNTLYEINGTIVLTSKINLNNAWLRGADAINDKLIYMGAGELFTGSAGGNVRFLTLAAPNAGTKVFNLDAAGANVNFILQNCYIGSSNNVGNIKNFGGTVFLQTVGFLGNTNGITFENDSIVLLNNTLWDKNGSNTYQKFIGNFGVIQMVTGAMEMNVANSAVGIDVSGITNVRVADLKSVTFAGNGTYKVGSFSKDWEVESEGLDTEKDDVASGNMYVSTTAATAFSALNVPTKVLGTTSSASLFRVTTSGNNRLIYSGKKTRRFQVICSLTGTQGATNIIYAFYIAKNGSILNESKQVVKFANSSDQQSVNVCCTVQLATNDYIEVWVENKTNTTALTVQSLNLAMK
jgi:hypothetical protein